MFLSVGIVSVTIINLPYSSFIWEMLFQPAAAVAKKELKMPTLTVNGSLVI